MAVIVELTERLDGLLALGVEVLGHLDMSQAAIRCSG